MVYRLMTIFDNICFVASGVPHFETIIWTKKHNNIFIWTNPIQMQSVQLKPSKTRLELSQLLKEDPGFLLAQPWASCKQYDIYLKRSDTLWCYLLQIHLSRALWVVTFFKIPILEGWTSLFSTPIYLLSCFTEITKTTPQKNKSENNNYSFLPLPPSDSTSSTYQDWAPHDSRHFPAPVNTNPSVQPQLWERAWKVPNFSGKSRHGAYLKGIRDRLITTL